MMRIIACFLVALTLQSKSIAQDFEGKAYAIVDSLAREPLDWDDTVSFDYQQLHDSTTRQLIDVHLQAAVSEGKYSWPFWYLRNDWGKNPPHDTGVRYPSPTQQQLMETKYAVSMNYPSNGCMWQRAFVIHDSLMMAAIRKRYGFDFFQRVKVEADSLDSVGLGLRFPYINSPEKTDSVLRKAFQQLVSTMGALGEEGNRRELEIYFQKGKAAHAKVMNDAGYAIFFDHALNSEKPYVGEIVQTLSWTSPTFLGRPVDRTVLWNVATGQLRWR